MDDPAKPAVPESLQSRLAGIERALGSNPALAEKEAAELLAAVPEQPMALLFQGIARRLAGNPAGAIEVLRPLCETVEDAPLPYLQLALALRETGDNDAALRAMRRAVAIKPDFSDAWLALADLLTAMADAEGADQAYGSYIRHATHDPLLREAAAELRENRTAAAETLLRRHLGRHAGDVCALCMLADVAQRHGHFEQAENLLRRCLELAPGYALARHNLASVLVHEDKPSAALSEAHSLLADDPENADARNLKAAIHMRLGDYSQAIALFEKVLESRPNEPAVWASLGHALRTVGRFDACIEAYRKAVDLAPEFGEASWNLANLKTYRSTDAELEAMLRQVEKPELRSEDRAHFHFAIGKALEDRAAYGESFRHYAAGNRLRRDAIPYNAGDFTDHVRRSIDLFTPEFFAERAGWGASSEDPVFVVGLPRSGSTLVEQILGSHSAVEGTMELPYVVDIAKRLAARASGSVAASYLERLARLEAGELRELGESYIQRSGEQRKLTTPFFVDKMPNNFAHLGLILLMLPNAHVVDVRRHPLACGMSLFKHAFASGQPFSYSLEDIGAYYRDYAELMAHFDTVLPGRVHRIVYESLVENTDMEVRRLLDYCGLDFEEGCLRFFENRRAVSTPSSEQVRSPIFREGLAQWRQYEPWLGPLRAELGALADTWRGARNLP